MKKIWGVRSGLIGDIVIALPVVSYMKQEHPDSYFNFVIDRAHSQCAPLFYNHPLIDRIKITDKKKGYGEEDLKIINSCDIVFDCAPPSLPPFWWNTEGLNLIHATWVMAGLKIEDYHSLPDDLKLPKLYRWWDKQPMSGKNIALWPIASYKGGDMARNPSVQQWKEITSKLVKEGYNIFQFGWHENPEVGDGDNYENCSQKSFIEQIQKSLDCDIILGIESGATWSLGAYGEIPQLNLLIMSEHHNHTSNPLAWEPLGKKSSSYVVRDRWSNLDVDEVVEKVKEIK